MVSICNTCGSSVSNSSSEAEVVEVLDAADLEPVTVAVTPSSYRRSFLVLFVSLISLGMGQSLVFAVLPPAGRDMGFTELQVGSIFTVSALLWMLGAPYWGNRSDLLGRRPLILLGLSAFSISMGSFAVCLHLGLSGHLALMTTFVMLIVARAIFGGFGSAAVPSAQAYIADRTAPHERASQLAALSAAFALGIIVGPAVVAVMLPFGFTAPFYAVAVLGGLGALAVALFLPKDPPPTPRSTGERVKLKLVDPRVWPFLVVAVIIEIAQAMSMQAAGFYAMDVLGMSSTEGARAVGIALMGTAGAVLFAQLIVIRVLQPSPRALVGVGALAGVVGFAVIVFVSTYPAMFAAMTLLGFATGLMRPGVIAGASVSVGADEQGGVAGLMNATGGLAVVISPFVGMPLYKMLPQAPYLLSMVLTALVILFVLMNSRLRAVGGRSLLQ